MSSLKITDLNKVYPSGETALYDVSLETRDKEFIVIAGGEKSGKSTLLRIIAGLEDETSGEVLIDGKDMKGVDPKNRDLAMVFKSSSLYPSLNVYDNMAYGLRLRKASEALISERIKVVSEMLGLTDCLYRKPKVLTSAARQRVAIGRAIVREPGLYLFDDPLSGLDEKLRADMLNLIINIQARLNGTFIYATKNLEEAMTIGTRLVILKNGFVQQIDCPLNLYDYPANTYVAFFIGSPTINFIKKVKIVSENGGYAGVCKDFKITLPENIVKRFESIGDYADKDKYVTLGLRPEDLKAGKEGEIKAKVISVDGDEEKYAECAVTPDISLNCATEEELEKGAEVNIEVDNTRLYIFDAETCLTLLKRDGGYRETGMPNADYVPMPYGEEQKIYESLNPKSKKKKK